MEINQPVRLSRFNDLLSSLALQRGSQFDVIFFLFSPAVIVIVIVIESEHRRVQYSINMSSTDFLFSIV